MFRSFYAITKDRKGDIHQYRLTPGERVPGGENIIGLRVAGQHNFADFFSDEDIDAMYAVAAQSGKPATKKVRRKRAPKE